MIGENLGSFRIESILGSGAMGVVYKAVNENTGRPAAVKVIGGETSQKGKAYERFRREAEILQQFRHPNIVRFLALGRYKGTSYFAMEYVDGVTLEEVLKRRGALPWREAVDLTIQICDALHYAHEHGVVHRDLKPSNLMVTAKGQVKLTDFGIAKDLDATALTATGRTLGTAAYMAPEQIRGTPEISHKTDLYALGILIYQMLTGQPAFEGTSAVVLMHCHLNEAPPKPSARTAEMPVEVDDLAVRLMAKSPSDRPWDAAAVAHSLRELREKLNRGESVRMAWAGAKGEEVHPTRLGVTATQPARPSAKAKRRRPAATLADLDPGEAARRRIGTAVLGAALVAVGGFIAYALWPPGAAYLYRMAEAKMASGQRSDWIEAREKYIDPLDRIPDHPYREATRAWRDRIELADAEARAKALTNAVVIGNSNEPKNDAERIFVQYSTPARASSEHKDDLAAKAKWEAMAGELNPDDPEQRPWFLLAKKRAAELQASMDGREKLVSGLLNALQEAEAAGRRAEAETIRRDIFERFGEYTALTDLLKTAGVIPPPAPDAPPATPPTP